MLLASLFACSFSSPSTPPAQPAPAPVVVEPIPPPAQPAAPEQPPAPSDPRLAELMKAASEVSTEVGFADLLASARELASLAHSPDDLDLTNVPLLMGFREDISGDYSVHLPTGAWLEIARKTSSKADDAYVALAGKAYGHLGGGGLQIYDGSCVVTDVVLQLFTEAVRAPAPSEPGSLLDIDMASLRGELLAAVVDSGHCPGDDEVLRTHVRVLLQLDLTPEEREQIEVALPALATLSPDEVDPGD